MKIAMLISGRITRYEIGLLKVLENTPYHDIHLFLSINNEDNNCNYLNTMKKKLNNWIKKCYIKKFIIPKEVISIPFDRKLCNQLQMVDNIWCPYNNMSCYWNWKNAFEMAIEYADKNNFEYDLYMTFRAEMINLTMPKIFPTSNDICLFTAFPDCYFSDDIPSCCWDWGNRKTMALYCEAIDYYINDHINNKNPSFHFETIMYNNLKQKNVKVIMLKNLRYELDKNRRMFDLNWEKNKDNQVNDLRIHNIKGCILPIDITNADDDYSHL